MTFGISAQTLIFAVVCWPVCTVVVTTGLYFLMPASGFARTWKRPWFAVFWASAPVPALAAALAGQEAAIELAWLMMGGVWQTGGLRTPFLGFTALLWLTAGIYAHGYMAEKASATGRRSSDAGFRFFRFAVFWGLALAGNLLLVIAADIPGFYAGYALMTFSAYALVIQEETTDARRGAAAYIIMAVIGESLLLGGLLWGAGSTEAVMLSELRRGLAESEWLLPVTALLLAGFGVKAGLAGLHMWLPMAHPVAPTPASAVLSGAMIKAGLLGWFFALPVGLVALPATGWWLTAAGLAGAFGAAAYGVFHRDPKVVLAYSSVSQMGMIASVFGLCLARPGLWDAAASVLVFFAAHHGLTKGALFLGTGITGRPSFAPAAGMWVFLVLPALSLAGMAGSGLAVKWGVKSYLYENHHGLLAFVLSLAAVGTALLMIRTLFLQYRQQQDASAGKREPAPPSMVFGWLACVLGALAVPWWLFLPEGLFSIPPAGRLPGLLWPGAAGGAIAVALCGAIRYHSGAYRLFLLARQPPAGDFWWVLAMAVRPARLRASAAADFTDRAFSIYRKSVGRISRYAAIAPALLDRIEPFFRVWAAVLMVFSAVLIVFVLFFST